MKKGSFLLVLSLLFISLHSFSQNYGNITYGEALNISGKQRMLSQKMSKVYMMRLMGSSKEDIEEEFKGSTRLFNKNLIKLEENETTSSAKTKQLIDDEKLQWEKFLNKFLLNPSKDVNELLGLANGLLDKCKVLVTSIENDVSSNDSASADVKLKAKTVNTSGKQRMLSQRLSLYYLASKLNASKPQLADTQKELKLVFEEMEKSFEMLSKSELNTAEINDNFKIIINQFALIKGDKAGFENQSIDVSKILAFSNKVTSTYNIITGLYAKL